MHMNALTADRILRLGEAFRESKVLLSAVEVGIFTALADGPLDLETLRTRVGIDERGARDFLDSLVALGMLTRQSDGRYANTAETDLYLDRDKPSYVGGILESAITRTYATWGSLTAALRSGKPQNDLSIATKFSGLYADDALRDAFMNAMTARTRPVAKALAGKFPWKSRASVIDVGGAQGCLPVEIALVHRHITGGVFDLPPLQGSFDRLVQEHGLAGRLRFYPGDFFNGPLPAADVLVLGRVLHNWDLATKRMLLRKAYDALPPDGTLIVYEQFIDDERMTNTNALLASLQMLLSGPGGFNFTGTACIGWMHETGFRDIQLDPLTPDQSMVVGMKPAT
jgi:O-methyltransferase domain/Dimerisation domain